jgi:hypothetical protein
VKQKRQNFENITKDAQKYVQGSFILGQKLIGKNNLFLPVTLTIRAVKFLSLLVTNA